MRLRIRHDAIRDLAGVLAIVCSDQTIADLMNATLSIEAEARLTDYQCGLGEVLFDQLTSIRADCIPLAQGEEINTA